MWEDELRNKNVSYNGSNWKLLRLFFCLGYNKFSDIWCILGPFWNSQTKKRMEPFWITFYKLVWEYWLRNTLFCVKWKLWSPKKVTFKLFYLLPNLDLIMYSMICINCIYEKVVKFIGLQLCNIKSLIILQFLLD